MLEWTRPRVAGLTDDPLMTLAGDWSGVRDSSEEAIWRIFCRFRRSISDRLVEN